MHTTTVQIGERLRCLIFKMPREFELHDGCTVTIGEFQSLDNDAAAVVWDAGVVLCYYLSHLSSGRAIT